MKKYVGMFSLILLLIGHQDVARPLTIAGTGLLITEVYYNTPGADEREEWIEIANVGSAALDLTGYKLGDEETAGSREGMVQFPTGARLESGQSIIVAQTTDGFRALFGFNPDYEMRDSDPAVPDMLAYLLWATGEVALANGGDEILLLDGNDNLIDAINYGDNTTYFAPSIIGVLTGQSIERVPADCDTDSSADWLPQPIPTPGEIRFDGDCLFPTDPASDEEFMPIGQIQGRGSASPHVNQVVTFRGVVTGLYEDRNTSGITYYTLFVQDLPDQEDGDPATSDGIALFLGREQPNYQPGDQVRVTGQVTEFFGFTEIDDNGLVISVEASNVPLPEPIFIDPPADNPAQAAYFEPLEGMRVALDGTAQVVGPTFSGCGFAVVSEASRVSRVRRRSLADPVGQIVPVLHTSDVDCTGFPVVKSGDRITGLVGPLTYHFDQFKLVLQQPSAVVVTSAPLAPPPVAPTVRADQFSLASFNLENYFDALDDTGDAAEPKPATSDIAIKQMKLAYAIGHTLRCPTLIAIQEVEKGELLQALATQLAAPCGFTYQVTHQDSADGRGIDVALLSDPRRVTVTAAALHQSCTPLNTGIRDRTITCPAGEFPLSSRPPFAVSAMVDGRSYTFIVNHFKSKRGGERETAPQRLAQAQHINKLVAELLTADANARIVVVGDFNDYEQAPAMLEMTKNGDLTNVLLQVPDAERYSFVFAGAAQLIDGILLSPALLPDVAAVTILHLNADYPSEWATDVSPTYLPHRSTDHDLPLLVLHSAGSAPAPEPGATTSVAFRPVWLWWLGGGLLGVLIVLSLWLRRVGPTR